MFNRSRVGMLMYNASSVPKIGASSVQGRATTLLASGKVASAGSTVNGRVTISNSGNAIRGANDNMIALGSTSFMAIAYNFGDILISASASVDGTCVRVINSTSSITAMASLNIGVFVIKWIPDINTVKNWTDSSQNSGIWTTIDPTAKTWK